ncbi:hypothetical protein TELCIR_23722, partial [Teladorsagia circumcincta]
MDLNGCSIHETTKEPALARHPLSDIPAHVSATEMADALEMKFQTSQYCLQAKQHLVNRLKPTQQGFIALDNFMK